MKLALVVEVDDEWVEQRAREGWEEYEGDTRGAGPPSGMGYFRARLEDIASDELPIALWGWPITVTVEDAG